MYWLALFSSQEFHQLPVMQRWQLRLGDSNRRELEGWTAQVKTWTSTLTKELEEQPRGEDREDWVFSETYFQSLS
jgi:hypothetical protein